MEKCSCRFYNGKRVCKLQAWLFESKREVGKVFTDETCKKTLDELYPICRNRLAISNEQD